MKQFLNNQEHNKYVVEAYYPTIDELNDEFITVYNHERFVSLWIHLLREKKYFYEVSLIYERYDDFLVGFANWAREFESITGTKPFNAIRYRLRSKSDPSDIKPIPINSILTYHPEEGYFIGNVISDNDLFRNGACRIVSLRSGKIFEDELLGEPTAIVNGAFHLNTYFGEWYGKSFELEDYENDCTIIPEYEVLQQSNYALNMGEECPKQATCRNHSFEDYEIEIVQQGVPFHESEEFKAAALKYPSIMEMKDWAF